MTLKSLIKFELSIAYSQLCVFDADLQDPYNEWLPEHTLQRFSWRPGSVSFATIVDVGDIKLQVELSNDPIQESSTFLLDAECVISVPFTVPIRGRVEVGSIMTGKLVMLTPGPYQLVFSDFGEKRRLKLTFCPCCDTAPSILKSFGPEAPPTTLLMSARPG